MEIRDDTPVVVYKNKEIPLEPFLIFTHEGTRFMASGWDKDDDGDEAFLTYYIEEPNNVIMGLENYAQPGEKIPVDSLPYVQNEGWIYIEEDVHIDYKEGKDIPEDSAHITRDRINAAREKVTNQSIANEALRADISRTKDKESMLRTIATVDDREEYDVGIVPTDELLDTELEEIGSTTSQFVAQDDMLMDFIGINEGDDDNDPDIPDAMLDAIMEEFSTDRAAKNKAPTTGRPTSERKRLNAGSKAVQNQDVRKKELESKGISDIGENVFKAEMEARKRYNELLDKEVLAKESKLAKLNDDIEMLESDKSSFQDAPAFEARNSVLGTVLHGAKDEPTQNRRLPVRSGDGFRKIIAIQSLTQEVIIENAELLLILAGMSVEHKTALRTIADAIYQIP